jgi:DNA helicase IV
VEADYEPLPALVAAARRIFEHEPLPQIRRARSAGIPEALESLQRIAGQAQRSGERHLALVTGVPGAGKTLVGLQFVYLTRFSEDEAERPAVFLSGNGPLEGERF